MKTFAVIENGIVVNIIVGVEPEVVTANPTKYVEYTDTNLAWIGGMYDTTAKLFSVRPTPQVRVPDPAIASGRVHALSLGYTQPQVEILFP